MFGWLKKHKEKDILEELGLEVVTPKELKKMVDDHCKMNAEFRRLNKMNPQIKKPMHGKCGKVIENDYDNADYSEWKPKYIHYYCGKNGCYIDFKEYIKEVDVVQELCTDCRMLKPIIYGKCGNELWVEYENKDTWNTIYKIKGCSMAPWGKEGDNAKGKTGAELIENFCIDCPKLKPARRNLY